MNNNVFPDVLGYLFLKKEKASYVESFGGASALQKEIDQEFPKGEQ